MELQLIEKHKEKDIVTFSLSDATPAFANMLRRYIIEEVPVMSIEDVEFRKNSSVLYDEMLAQRLGLVPLKTDLKSYNLPANCKCEGKGCASCQLKLVLRAKGPGVVYSSEIKSKDPKVKPVFAKIPIVKLLKGQLLEVEATATLGKGRDHAKWSAAHVYFKNKPLVEVSGELDLEVATRYPYLFEVKGNKASLNKTTMLKYDVFEDVSAFAKGKVKVSEKEDEFIFTVESFGQLEHADMVGSALAIFEEHLEEFTEKIKKS